MKKLLKSEICGSINSTLMHYLLWKSQHLRLLFNKQYMNSNRVTPKCVKKKKKRTKTQLVKRRRGFSGSKHTLKRLGLDPVFAFVFLFLFFSAAAHSIRGQRYCSCEQ